MIQLAYIASTSYCGSTLLTLMLNRHPGIATLGELKWGPIEVATYPCSCGTRLVDCPFWRELGRALNEAGHALDWANPETDFRLRGRPALDRIARARNRGAGFERMRHLILATTPGVRSRWSAVRARNEAVIEAALALRGADIFVDASKDPVRLKHLIDSGDYKVRIIHLVRDGRGFIHSAMRHGGMNPAAASKEWVRTHEQIERLGRQVGAGRVFQLRYEDLCARPDDCMASLIAFLGLPPLKVDWRADGQAEHHIVGNRMRLQSKINVQLNESWRDELTAKAESVFNRIAGVMNGRYSCPSA